VNMLATRASSGARTVALRASLVWHDEVMEDIVLEKPQKITIGSSAASGALTAVAALLRLLAWPVLIVLRIFLPELGRARSTTPTFVVPEIGLPAMFQIIKPGNRGYVMTLGEKMRGTICIDGKQQDVAEFLRNAGDSDSRGGFRA